MNILPHYNKYNINKIKQIFDSFFSKKIKIVITVHDFFYLDPLNPNMLIKDFDNMILDELHISIINYIFKNSYQVIFPLNKTLENYLKKGIRLEDNFIVSDHIDIEYKNSIEYYHKIEDEIRVLFLGNQSLIKGYDIIDYLSNNIKILKNKTIKYYYLGNFNSANFAENVIFKGKYEYKDVFKILIV